MRTLVAGNSVERSLHRCYEDLIGRKLGGEVSSSVL